MRKLNTAQKIILVSIFVILSIPFIEQLDGNANFNWTLFDFIIAFLMLFSFGFGLEYAIRKIASKKIKLLVLLLILISFLILWGELAVGIFDSPIAGD